MGYCFMTIDKIKSEGQMISMQKHNFREKEVPNADPEKAHLNDILIDMNGETCLQKFQKRMESLDYYKTHTFRKNGVMALDVVLTFSREDAEHVDVEAWKEANLQWLRAEFNARPDLYGENLVSAVYHGDEAGNVHIHAMILPVDGRGKFNASYYIDGSHTLIALQDSYAEKMKVFGLDRGIRGSTAKHQDIKKFYTELNQQIYGRPVPVPEKGESMESYVGKVKEEMKTLHAAHLREVKKIKQDTIKEVMLRGSENEKKVEKLQEENRQLREEKEKMDELIHEYGEGSIETVEKKCRSVDFLNQGLTAYPDRAYAENILEGINRIHEYMQKEKRKKKKNKEYDRSE